MTIDELLKLFCGTDPIREWMLQPNEQNGYVYATDSWKYIRIPVSQVSTKYKCHEKTANFDFVRNVASYFESPQKIKRSSLKDILTQIPTEFVSKDCPTCEGEGGEDCHCCGQFVECRNCDGRGSVPDKNAPLEYKNGSHLIKINGVLFNPYVVGSLRHVVAFTGKEEFDFVARKIQGIHLFRFDDIEVALMPTLEDYIDDKEILELI